jgi:peptide/nickel transport system substrate-binding protein
MAYDRQRSDASPALISGDLDIVIDVPTQDVTRLASAANLKVERTDEFRTIFFGFDLRTTSCATGRRRRQPVPRPHVRGRSTARSISGGIQRAVMRGLATPTGQGAAPGNVGYDRTLDTRLGYDPAAARRLLAEAGYPNGFGSSTPQRSYVNDEQVCRALTAMLTGRAQRHPERHTAGATSRIRERDTSMFAMGQLALFRRDVRARDALHDAQRSRGRVQLWPLFEPGADAAIRARATRPTCAGVRS